MNIKTILAGGYLGLCASAFFLQFESFLQFMVFPILGILLGLSISLFERMYLPNKKGVR